MLERPEGLAGERLGEGGEHTVGDLHEQNAATAGIDRTKVATHGVAGELGDLPRHLHAGRSRAHHHKGQPPPSALGVGLHLGRLERAEYPGADRQRAFQ